MGYQAPDHRSLKGTFGSGDSLVMRFLVLSFAFTFMPLTACESSSHRPTVVTAAKNCCKICTKGCACGDSCISCDNTCHKGEGCACDAR
jgi:hypothetical protein